MSHSKQTANYGLPLFEPKDRPAWLTDFNGAMTAVDATVKGLEDSIQAGGLPITGGTMRGSINMGDHAITNVQEVELPGSGDGLYIGSVVQPNGTAGARLTGVAGSIDGVGGAALVKPDKQSEYVNLSVATPSRPEHSATKMYVDEGINEANQMAVLAYNTANGNAGDIAKLQTEKQDAAIQRRAGIPVASWTNNTATVTVQGVTAINIVIVSPAPESVSVWGESVVYCSAQAANSLTFTCSETPTAALTVNVIILN